MPQKLLLFDIDGTLLTVSGVNRTILMDALLEVYGTSGTAATHNFAGRMDSLIIREVLAAVGMGDKRIDEGFEQAKSSYIERFRQQAVPADVTLHDGVVELLEALSSRSDCLLGLLTGNFERSGRHKLSLPGIDHYFPFGAFADDALHRNDLPAVALEKARRLTGRSFEPGEVVIIGDTEHDIACAKASGARSLAVATGTYSMERLAQHEPDLLMENLSGTARVLEGLFANQPT